MHPKGPRPHPETRQGWAHRPSCCASRGKQRLHSLHTTRTAAGSGAEAQHTAPHPHPQPTSPTPHPAQGRAPGSALPHKPP